MMVCTYLGILPQKHWQMEMVGKTDGISSCNYSLVFTFGNIYTNTCRCLPAVFEAETDGPQQR